MNRKNLTLALAIALALILLPALLSFLGKAQTAHAAIFVVTIFHDEDDGVCDSSCSIRDAIFAATNGDDITIPAGTYTLSDTNGSLVVAENLIFNGNSATDTFIDAQQNSRVFNVTSGTATFNDLTIQGGLVTGAGGGINATGAASLIVNNAVITGNQASTNGGGIAFTNGTVTLNNTQIMINIAGNNGGGIYSNNGSIIFDNSQVLTNTAVFNGGGIALNLASASLTMNSGQINGNNASLAALAFPGGGLYVAQGTAVINGGEIRNNTAFRGGGVLVSSGTLTIDGGQIIDNEANYGGGVYVRHPSATVTLNSGEITLNRSIDPTEFGGGGLYIFQGDVTMNGGEISFNTAINDGGAMEIGDASGRFTLNSGNIFSNSAGNTGGAIYAAEGTLTINGGTIHSNDSGVGGGGISTGLGSETTIQNAALLTNTTSITTSGGAINNAGTLTMTNVTVSSNSAGSGGGLNNSGTAVLINVTFSENNAMNNGGGLLNSSGTLTVGNSIIFGNTAGVGADCNGTITTAGNNISSCGLAGSGDSGSDPLLEPLALNNGATLNYALGTGSPAIDAGNNATCPATDQRGNMRPVNLTCDIGAYEDGIGFSISDATLTEGDAGSSQMSFIVSRSFMTSTTYTVTYATLDGDALAGLDYTAVSTTTLTFPAATMTQTVNIDILGDLLDETDEQFTVELLEHSPEVSLGNASGSGTILDDDDPPTISINDVTLAEGDSGTATAVFTATLSAPSTLTVTVEYDTVAGTAVSPADFEAASGTLTFAPGDILETISITVNEDELDEIDETATVTLSNESNATLADGSGLLTITDDDPEPTISIANSTVTEGNNGTTSADFIVMLSAPSGKTVTVNYMTAANTATAGVDYDISSGTLTFAPGDTSETVSVSVNGDAIDEFNETFDVNLSSATNATLLDGSAVGTISDDDPLPTITIDDVVITEGDSGTATAVFTISLLGASEKVISVDVNSSDGTALAGVDYTAVSTTLTFNPGDPLSKTVTILINGDEESESDETFFLTLSNPTNTTVTTSQATGTITDDDGFFIYLPFIISP